MLKKPNLSRKTAVDKSAWVKVCPHVDSDGIIFGLKANLSLIFKCWEPLKLYIARLFRKYSLWTKMTKYDQRSRQDRVSPLFFIGYVAQRLLNSCSVTENSIK